MTATTQQLQFLLNGKQIAIDNPSPEVLLVDYLRSPSVGLTGTKKPCGQGGCGGCTVILSDWQNGQVRHRAVNSCLRRLCSLQGMAVTTIEGTGSVAPSQAEYLPHRMAGGRGGAPIGAQLPQALLDAANPAKSCGKTCQASDTLDVETDASIINPVAHRLAVNNGSQCGYCSVGFVMNMSEFITNNPSATKQEIEDAFDGNLCRCTGYRPILTGMKTFASDWSSEDEAERMKCLEDPIIDIPNDAKVRFPVPDTSPFGDELLSLGGKVSWLAPQSIADVAACLTALDQENKSFMFVAGGTSFGIYPEEFKNVDAFIDLGNVAELEGTLSDQNAAYGSLDIPLSSTYSNFIHFIEASAEKYGASLSPEMPDLNYMLRRTAGRIVRNAATLGGNLALFLKHIAAGTGDPFPSDIATAIHAMNGTISYYDLNDAGSGPKLITENFSSLVARASSKPAEMNRIVLAKLQLPFLGNNPKDICISQKTALREVNSHTIINSKTYYYNFDAGALFSIVYGGVNGGIWAPSLNMGYLPEPPTLEFFLQFCEPLYAQAKQALTDARPRMQGVPDEGFTEEYKAQLIVGQYLKAAVHILNTRNLPVPENIKSAGDITWGAWGVSDGVQDYVPQGYKAPVAQPYIKSTALEQCSGQTHYTHELSYPQGTLHAAFVQSRSALGKFSYQWTDGGAINLPELAERLANEFPSFSRLITCTDIPAGGLNLQGMALDQPLFANGEIRYYGQSIGLVLATDEAAANKIAEFISAHCLAYADIDWPNGWTTPILSLEDAVAKNSVFPDTPDTASFLCHIWKITRPRSRFDWMASTAQPPTFQDLPTTQSGVLVDGASCTRVVNNQKTGGQAHFYLESQSCVAIPADEGRIIVNSSTQSPMEMQQTVAMALGRQYNKVKLQTRLLGGAFGGKTEQARFTTGPTAVAAAVTNAPVRLAMERDADTALIGKRHAIIGEAQIAVDEGKTRAEEKGIIRGMHLALWTDGGAYYDCSYVVSNCIQTRIDNAYMIDNFESVIDVCRTNTAPNTAMRGFGDLQAKNVQENLIDDAAEAIGMRPEALREKNFYVRGDVTPYGQNLTACYMAEVWNYLKKKIDFDQKLADVQAYNAANKWRKRGIALIPVKYGSGYNFEQLKQASAIVVVNQADGSVVIHQGGVDMGQGLLTQVKQVAAYVLGIPLSLIHVESPQTDTTPNTSSSGASTGTPYSAEAVKRTCEQLRKRLLDFGYEQLKDNGNDWCAAQGIDFWNHGTEGWAAEVTVYGRSSLIWQNLIQLAYVKRIGLTTAFNIPIENGQFHMPVLTFKQPADQPTIPGIQRADVQTVTDVQNQFVGFTYSAACAIAEVDILTGEAKILSSDIVYDIGWSLNPALDIGQIEGAFIQGLGFLTSENLVLEPEGDDKGRLNTVNTWRYKIPAQVSIPLQFNVSLFPRNDPSVVDIPPDDQGIFSAKEVGEPPLILANAVFFAIKDAVRESRRERGLGTLFQMRAPATVQEISKACAVDIGQFG